MPKKRFSAKYRNYIVKRHWTWVFRSKLCKVLLLGRCCICPLLPGGDAAHLTYKNIEHELPLRDIVPMNRFFHRIFDSQLLKPFRPVLNWLVRGLYLFWIGVEAWALWWFYGFTQDFREQFTNFVQSMN